MSAVVMMKFLPKRELKTPAAHKVVQIFCSSSIRESLSYQINTWSSLFSETAINQGVGGVQTGWQILSILLLMDNLCF